MKRSLKPAKVCFHHIGGKLGTLLMDSFIDNGWIKKSSLTDKHFFITKKGEIEFSKLGIDLSQIEPEQT
jgi:hypothetical protein